MLAEPVFEVAYNDKRQSSRRWRTCCRIRRSCSSTIGKRRRRGSKGATSVLRALVGIAEKDAKAA